MKAERLALRVAAGCEPSLSLTDKDGKVIERLPK
jgi:hypothetical protein